MQIPFLAYDSFSKQLGNPTIPNSVSEVDRNCHILIEAIRDRNVKAGVPATLNDGKPNAAAYTAHAVHRVTGEHRLFTLAPSYPGHLGHAEALKSSAWYCPTDEELESSAKAALDPKPEKKSK